MKDKGQLEWNSNYKIISNWENRNLPIDRKKNTMVIIAASQNHLCMLKPVYKTRKKYISHKINHLFIYYKEGDCKLSKEAWLTSQPVNQG